VRTLAALVVVFAACCAPGVASGYGWPLRPFDRPHPIRGAFGDPRFHLDLEGQISAFHFGVDIAAADGTPVYAVEPGYAHARSADVSVESRSGRLFGYWHIRPIVHTGQHIRMHQLLGYIGYGWGHLHFAESFRGAYKDPLRPGALTPFFDRGVPTIEAIELRPTDATPLDPTSVTGSINVVASIYELPPLAPPAPWQLSHLSPAVIWWVLSGPDGVSESALVVDFEIGLPPNSLYSWVYAPGTYQNKPDRPGRYLFWLAHDLDTTALPDGQYRLTVYAESTRHRIGSKTIVFQTENGVGALPLRAARPRSGRAQPQ
jgi:murein DD-endopeptidase MepM/ murein hydrolase activator NlpD